LTLLFGGLYNFLVATCAGKRNDEGIDIFASGMALNFMAS